VCGQPLIGAKWKITFCSPFCFPDYDENEENSKPDRERCLILLGKALKSSDVPVSCLAYKDIQQKLKRKDSKHDYAVAFEGMASGEATAAMAARDKGMLHHAQVQRRMTKPQYRKFY
jgi:hypothetical protein